MPKCPRYAARPPIAYDLWDFTFWRPTYPMAINASWSCELLGNKEWWFQTGRVKLSKYYYVYAWFDGQVVFYIGKGKGSRAIAVASHSKVFQDKVRSCQAVCKLLGWDMTESDAARVEKSLIGFLNPETNRAGKRSPPLSREEAARLATDELDLENRGLRYIDAVKEKIKDRFDERAENQKTRSLRSIIANDYEKHRIRSSLTTLDS